MWNQLSVQVLYKAFCPGLWVDVFWTFINGDSRLLYGTFSGVVKSDLWQSNNVLCVFVCADRVGYDHQQQNQFAECEYGQLSVFCLFSCNRRYTVGNFSYVYAGVHCNDFWDNGRYFWRNSSFLDMSLKRI